jgi:hypothetical protein
MLLVKSLIILAWNILPVFLIVLLIKLLLFYPKKEKKFRNGKRMPFTPGLAYKGKEWLINKLEKLVRDYLADTKDDSRNTRLSKWEDDVFQKAWDKLEFIDRIRFLPHKIKENIRFFISLIFYQLIRHFLRSFVPFMMEHYQVEEYIYLIDRKIDMAIIKSFFDKKIFRYLMYFVVFCGFLWGIWNILMFLIIR